MLGKRHILCLLGASLLLIACCSTPKIDRRPAVADYQRGLMTEIPTYNPESNEYWQMDLRGYDLSQLDLSNSLEDLYYTDFDDRTTWPSKDRMPMGYDWKQIMELGKNPGLGVRSLHAQGITGKGVSIAIVDQVLLIEHQEYANRLQLYEEINVKPNTSAQMHGAAVASIAVGKTIGVAPGADLYYIASWTGDWSDNGDFTWNFQYYAQAVRRILEINKRLPEDRKIRVISMQVGWNPKQKGYDDIMSAVEDAKDAEMLIVCSSIEKVHDFRFNGLGRNPMDDPELFDSYKPGLFWSKAFPRNERFLNRLMVPMDSRTTASPTGKDEYVFYRQGGWSWAIPYIAGVYALVLQVDPTVTPEQFWLKAMETGSHTDIKLGRKTYSFGPILNPVALISSIRASE